MMTVQTMRHREAAAVAGGAYSNENWIYTQILEYTDISQDWKKSKFAKEKAKKLQMMQKKVYQWQKSRKH